MDENLRLIVSTHSQWRTTWMLETTGACERKIRTRCAAKACDPFAIRFVGVPCRVLTYSSGARPSVLPASGIDRSLGDVKPFNFNLAIQLNWTFNFIGEPGESPGV